MSRTRRLTICGTGNVVFVERKDKVSWPLYPGLELPNSSSSEPSWSSMPPTGVSPASTFVPPPPSALPPSRASSPTSSHSSSSPPSPPYVIPALRCSSRIPVPVDRAVSNDGLHHGAQLQAAIDESSATAARLASSRAAARPAAPAPVSLPTDVPATAALAFLSEVLTAHAGDAGMPFDIEFPEDFTFPFILSLRLLHLLSS